MDVKDDPRAVNPTTEAERPEGATSPDAAGAESPPDCHAEHKRGRAPAGTDPAKRKQILDGADRVFSTMGFDAASMNDIAHEAGVSKGTLYVYFDRKEDLFTALVDEKRRRHVDQLIGLVGDDPDVRAALTRLGTGLVRFVTCEWALRAHRIVLGVAERMPDVGRTFYDEGPGRGKQALVDYLRRMTDRGILKIDDPVLAAAQFGELCKVNLVWQRLFRAVDTPPTDAEIAHVVDHAVGMFLAYYGRPQTDPTPTGGNA